MNAPAVDVFAFGVMAWRLFLPGHPSGVQNAKNLAEYAIAYRRMKSEPGRWLAELDARSDLRWLRQCLALEPDQRLQDGAALVEALRSSQMPASLEELAATQVASPGYRPSPASPGPVLSAGARPTPTSAPTAYSPGNLPQGNSAAGVPGAARSNRFVIGIVLGLAAAVLFAGVAVLGLSGAAAFFALGDRDNASAGPPSATCVDGSALAADREVTLWIGPVEISEAGSKRNLKSNEGVCLTNLRTRERRCARGNQWNPTVKARVGDLLSGGSGLLVQFEGSGGAETLSPRADLGLSTVTCPQSGWLMPLGANARLSTLPIFPR